MLRIYLHSSTNLKLCSDVPIVDFVDTWTSRYLGSNIWVLPIKMRGWKCGDESVGMKVWGWKCGDENVGMKMWEWKCGDENVGMKMLGMKNLGMKKAGDEKPGMKVKRWNSRGWSVTQPRIYHIDTFSRLSNLASNYFSPQICSGATLFSFMKEIKWD